MINPNALALKFGKVVYFFTKEKRRNYVLGEFSLYSDQLEEAEKYISTGLQKDPGSTEFAILLAGLRLKQNRIEEAKSIFQQIISNPSTEQRYLTDLGNVFAQCRFFPDAEVAYLKAVEKDPNNAIVFKSLGYLYYRQKRYSDAEIQFRKAILLDPNIGITHRMLSDTLLALGSFDESKVEADLAVKLDPRLIKKYRK